MRRNPRRLALWTVSIFCVLLLAACGSSSPTVKSISVIPATQTISATTTQQFTATLKYTDGATKPGAGLVAWSSGTTSVATIDPASGVATGAAAGTSTITATYKGVSGTATLSVNQLLSIAVTPMSAVIPNGATSTQQFTAMGTFKNPDGTTGNPQDITGMVTWASSVKAVATINGSGLATAAGTGVTSISAALYGVTSPSVSLTVGAPVVIGLKITPANPTTAVGNTVLFAAVELLSDNTTQALSGTVTWSSATTTVASIGANNGIALGVGAGTGTASSVITATESGTACPGPAACTGTATLNVQAATARFAYVANLQGGSSFSGSILGYTVDATAATLTPFASSVPASTPQQVLLHPSGDLMYYIDGAGFLHIDDIHSNDGSFADSGQAPTKASTSNTSTNAGVIDPTGRFIYVISSVDNSIYGFKITQTADKAPLTNGALSALSPTFNPYTDATLNNPTWIMTDRAGKYVYVVNNGSTTKAGNTISEYSIQPDGTLSPLPTPTIATGSFPLFGTTDVNGHLYVANEGPPQSVSGYSINSSTGQLTSVGADTPVTGATFTINVITDPTGKYLYVLDSTTSATPPSQVFAFNLNPANGVIGSQIGTPQLTGNSPTGMAIDPTGVFMAIDNNFDNTISLFKLSTTTGAVTPATPSTAPAENQPLFVVFYTAASGQ